LFVDLEVFFLVNSLTPIVLLV